MNFWLQIIGFGLAAYVIFVKLLKPLAKIIPSIVIKFTMSRIHKQVLNLKTKLFEEAFEKIETNNKTGKLEILELGVGSGENFRSFPKNSNITVLDVTDRFLPALQESIEQNRKDLTISKLVVSSAEKMTPIESNSMDAVVHTFMLCSIPDTTATLNEIYRVLKPGGVFIFVDHAAEPENKRMKIIQKIFETIQGECKFKDIRGIIQSGPFKELFIKNFSGIRGVFSPLNPVFYGYGIKSK